VQHDFRAGRTAQRPEPASSPLRPAVGDGLPSIAMTTSAGLDALRARRRVVDRRNDLERAVWHRHQLDADADVGALRLFVEFAASRRSR
jgi:hypothetical protein